MASPIPIFGRLFSVPTGPRRWYHIVLWWEARRVAYNVIVGLVGILSVLVFVAFASFRPRQFEDGPEPFAILVFGLGANLCFTGGWMAELLARLLWRERAAFGGPMMFSLGLIFSVGLCLLPPLVAAMTWLTTPP